MLVRTTIALGFMLAAPAVALAEDAAPATPAPATSTHWQACSAEIQKFCANIEKGKGLKRKCLESHQSELSDGCKAKLAEHAAKETDKPAQ